MGPEQINTAKFLNKVHMNRKILISIKKTLVRMKLHDLKFQ